LDTCSGKKKKANGENRPNKILGGVNPRKTKSPKEEEEDQTTGRKLVFWRPTHEKKKWEREREAIKSPRALKKKA